MPRPLQVILLWAGAAALWVLGLVGTFASENLLPMVLAHVTIAAMMYLWNRPQEVLRQRRERGQCLQCGYDLRGNESCLCPECGTAFEVHGRARVE